MPPAMPDPPVIDYAPATAQGVLTPKWSLPAWLVISSVLWLVQDWGVSVGSGPTAWRKFTLPLWFQISASLILGAIAVAALILLAPLVRRLRSKLRGAHS